ncbi:MAG: MBL fold metallo-hydrolase [Bacteroidota bacterium]
MKWLHGLLILSILVSCESSSSDAIKTEVVSTTSDQFVAVLGIAQDGGYPQAGCLKEHCKDLWDSPERRRLVSCLAVVDRASDEIWIFDATPDFKDQMTRAWRHLPNRKRMIPTGILLTHGHMGHYTGLIHLGREAIGADSVPVFAMPRMREFLTNNGPWSQLVGLGNIALKNLNADSTIALNDRISVTPLLVPHRDEFTETVGFRIEGTGQKVLFIPDIDKWNKWDRDIIKEIKSVDVAFIDGTFYQNGEIPGRDMSEIPHPFVEESMALFKDLPDEEKAKVHFIHLNHTNPLLNRDSPERKELFGKGFKLAEEGQIVGI